VPMEEIIPWINASKNLRAVWIQKAMSLSSCQSYNRNYERVEEVHTRQDIA
jgi:hypothetical protein